MYGLTQAFMQIPFGLASDRWGRRPVVIAGLLLFVAGSVVCAQASDVFWITIGRAIQGAGAISAAVTAWLADATRDEVRTRAMAMVGGSIGLSFAVSLVLSPVLVGWWGLSGLFWTIACLGVVCLAVARWVVPVVPRTQARAMQAARPREVLLHPDLLRLNFGVFVLHLVQVALFVVAPALLAKAGGLDARELWKVYLPVILVSFVLMVPVVFVAEKRRAHRGARGRGRPGAGVRAAADGQPGFLWFRHGPDRLFVVFNVLEALQPSLVSRVAPAAYKGLALGFYNGPGRRPVHRRRAGRLAGLALGRQCGLHRGGGPGAALAGRYLGAAAAGLAPGAADTPESRGTRRHQARTSGKSADRRDRFVTNGVGAAGAFRR